MEGLWLPASPHQRELSTPKGKGLDRTGCEGVRSHEACVWSAAGRSGTNSDHIVTC